MNGSSPDLDTFLEECQRAVEIEETRRELEGRDAAEGSRLPNMEEQEQ